MATPFKLQHPMRGAVRATRQRFGDSTDAYIRSVIHTVERLDGVYESLSQLAHTGDPTISLEGRALKIEKAITKADEQARQAIQRARADLDARLQSGYEKARASLGINEKMPHEEAREIRDHIKSLPNAKARTDFIVSAFSNGDKAVMRAITQSPSPALLGDHSASIDSLVRQAIDAADPSLPNLRDDIRDAQQHLDLATDHFVNSTEKLRNRDAAQRAQNQIEAIKQAEAALEQGMALPEGAQPVPDGGDNDGGDGAGEAA
jgi:hypothetical protein